MKYGINANDLQLRLVKKDKALFEGPVHERIYLHEKAGKLKNPLSHYSTSNISAYMRKLNVYTTLQSQVFDDRKENASLQKLIWRPLLVFMRTAFLKAGVLDGIEGLFFSILSSYDDFVSRAKLWEKRQNR